MKILFIYTYLISGLVRCFDVTGYTGGTVIIFCNYQQLGQNEKYFCKKGINPNTLKDCVIINHNQTPNIVSHKDSRIALVDTPNILTVVHKELSLQDSGSYKCGASRLWNIDLNLKVNTGGLWWSSGV
ncbi:CMRF35-like molecule 9 [Hoplias malabaricus]|uniref:CMRF35-like molecule 9 n=1 Tax=Hoplias malabaricus TaxID=27720 RepID=UPI0034632C00